MGREAPRKLIVAALIERGGMVLMSRRRHDQTLPDLWEFPGGKVEAGESPEDALVREIKEELGCTVQAGAVFDVVFHRYPEFDIVMLLYRCTLVAGEPQALQVAAIEWVAARDVPRRPLPPADVALAERIAREFG